MPLMEATAHEAPAVADAGDATVPTTPLIPLDDALHVLQADPGHSLADPGLARLPPAGLDRLFLAARRQAERNHDGILLLLDLLQVAQRADSASHRQLIPSVVRQLRHHVEDQQRWQALAENAAYYRDNRLAAERIAARLRTD
ncbi:hypothetical protein [Pseudoxanthomonas sp. SE1]|uniref:hypothetical protein n=1 Tax=Pseudoxanthomonas sp. SE1 TaxID=1664560 RepID=UPI00240E898A|nr:hypothetical protein [Pseudoxanthomonas sp. SE1]WFC41368.1 hypothetical protein OY559_16505 [Pseudoxanthomonas sp. SE1]